MLLYSKIKVKYFHFEFYLMLLGKKNILKKKFVNHICLFSDATDHVLGFRHIYEIIRKIDAGNSSSKSMINKNIYLFFKSNVWFIVLIV